MKKLLNKMYTKFNRFLLYMLLFLSDYFKINFKRKLIYQYILKYTSFGTMKQFRNYNSQLLDAMNNIIGNFQYNTDLLNFKNYLDSMFRKIHQDNFDKYVTEKLKINLK